MSQAVTNDSIKLVDKKNVPVSSKNKNSWSKEKVSSFSVEGGRNSARNSVGDFEYNPRGSRYLDVDDGILPDADKREKSGQWPPTRIVGAVLAVLSFIIMSLIEIKDPNGTDEFKKVNRCLAVLLPMIFLWLFSVFSPNLTSLMPILLVQF